MFKYIKGLNSFFVLNPKMHQVALDAKQKILDGHFMQSRKYLNIENAILGFKIKVA